MIELSRLSASVMILSVLDRKKIFDPSPVEKVLKIRTFDQPSYRFYEKRWFSSGFSLNAITFTTDGFVTVSINFSSGLQCFPQVSREIK